ncbi:hypothetical protein [Azotobacter beijerinckii]|uniref:Patatin-like phospholipase n=1 Tax=Azotobacter beijerinckii TaxID=170623 RepID=A0A1I1CIK0_9GAMM|nr:hypothetical protein [Azotobacter beijerinckii]SFB60728.1 hypothetical protein SAMN04244571_04224 [Azotobacter beijerinckii]
MVFSARRANGFRLERIQASRQYADGGFMNTYPSSVQRVPEGRPTLADFLFRGEGRTPANSLPVIDPRATWARPVETGLRATWLGVGLHLETWGVPAELIVELDSHRR